MRFILRIFSIVLAIFLTVTGCKNDYLPTGNNILISSFSPSEATVYESGNQVVLSVISDRNDLDITAYFYEKAVQLNREYSGEESYENSFCYSTLITMPYVNKKTKAGKIKFVCKSSDTEEIYYSGKITILPNDKNTNSAQNTEKSCIAEVINYPVETFDGDTIDDLSKPSYSLLPVGTVDYCSDSSIINSRINKNYRLLKYGRRVYDNSNIKIYEGSLPKNNILSVDGIETLDKYTVLSFSCDFKAPFTLELKGQEYMNPNSNNWNITDQNFTFVEIKFSYCNTLFGDIDFDDTNPLFSHSEKFTENDKYVLRLYLKEAGNFYGYKAEYDENDCLVFKFLQPTRLYKGDNEYGYSLSGKTIVIDAGHGGKDSGAISKNGVFESKMNLSLSKLISNELQKIGANVIMTRNDESYVSAEERLSIVYDAEPDFVISIHRNSGSSNGYGTYYFNPFSFDAATCLLNSNIRNHSYKNNSGTLWHYFFLNRTNICPSVLTENGYMSNNYDVKNMQNADHQMICAKATVKGIVDYFISQHS